MSKWRRDTKKCRRRRWRRKVSDEVTHRLPDSPQLWNTDSRLQDWVDGRRGRGMDDMEIGWEEWPKPTRIQSRSQSLHGYCMCCIKQWKYVVLWCLSNNKGHWLSALFSDTSASSWTWIGIISISIILLGTLHNKLQMQHWHFDGYTKQWMELNCRAD